jgi:hypothetical protein
MRRNKQMIPTVMAHLVVLPLKEKVAFLACPPDKMTTMVLNLKLLGLESAHFFPTFPPTKKLTLKEHPNLLTELGKNKKVDVALKPIQEILALQRTASVQSITLLD